MPLFNKANAAYHNKENIAFHKFKLNIIGLKRRNEHSYKTMILKDGIKQITKYCD